MHAKNHFSKVSHLAYLGVKDDRGGVATLGAGDGDAVTQFYPGHGQDGPGVRARQVKLVLLIVLQEIQFH